MATLSTLFAQKSPALVRSQLYQALRGVGYVKHSGTGSGSVGITGTARAKSSIVLEVLSSGTPGSGGSLRCSIDGGATWSTHSPVPASIDLTSSVGVTISLSGSESGGIDPFIQGDSYRCETSVPVLPTTAWQPFSVPATLADMAAQGLSDLTDLVCSIGRGGILDLAEGDWLTLLAAQLYGLERIGAAAALVSLTASNSTTSAIPISTGGVVVRDALGHRYKSYESASVPASSSVNVQFIAESAGNASNTVQMPLTLETTVAGLSLAIRDDASVSGLVAAGRDPETDAELRQRCKGRWSSLAKAANSDGYVSVIIGSVPTITRAAVISSPTRPGVVEISIANAAGGASEDEISAATSAVEGILPTCISAEVHGCTPVSVNLTASVDVLTGYSDSALTAIDEAFADLLSSTPIGGHVVGSRRILSREAIIAAVMSAPGVLDCDVSSPAEDVIMDIGQVPVQGTVSVTVAEV